MSDSTAPGPRATRRRRAGLMCFWLLMATCSVWVEGPGIGLPGPPRANDDDEEKEEIRCPVCRRPARREDDGSAGGYYICVLDHVSRRQPDGSYRWENDPMNVAPGPASATAEGQGKEEARAEGS
jgi:hypothetical protein